MILLPKILYVLWHSLVYISLRYFKIMDTLLQSFVWGPNRHKLFSKVLQIPTSLGGLAVPEFGSYYLPVQLSHFYHIDKTDKCRYLGLACHPVDSRVPHPFCDLLLHGLHGSSELPSRSVLLFHHKQIWDLSMFKMGTTGFHTNTSWWYNRLLPELL